MDVGVLVFSPMYSACIRGVRARRLVWDPGLGVGLWVWSFPVSNFIEAGIGMPNVISLQNLQYF